MTFCFGFRRPKAASTLRRLKCSGQVNCPCAEVLPAAKRSYGADAPPAGRPVCQFSCRCSSFPNRTRFAGLRFGFGCKPMGCSIYNCCTVESEKDICESRCLSFWVPPPKGRLHPSALHMLGGSEFRLRQGFAPAAQNACTALTRRRPEGRSGGFSNTNTWPIRGSCESSCLLSWLPATGGGLFYGF